MAAPLATPVRAPNGRFAILRRRRAFIEAEEAGRPYEEAEGGDMEMLHAVLALSDGVGEYIWHDGERYTGGWLNQQHHGVGVKTAPAGWSYSGTFIKSAIHGHGVYCFGAGGRYAGQWAEGSRQGAGVEADASGNTFRGRFHNGERGRYGVSRLVLSGVVYSGTFLEGKADGHGQEEYGGETTGYYRGEFHQGTRHGLGKREWGCSSVYVGQWHGDKRHGYGVLTKADGTVYAGAWQGDKPDGKGCLTKPTGEAFAGLFHAGQFAGRRGRDSVTQARTAAQRAKTIAAQYHDHVENAATRAVEVALNCARLAADAQRKAHKFAEQATFLRDRVRQLEIKFDAHGPGGSPQEDKELHVNGFASVVAASQAEERRTFAAAVVLPRAELSDFDLATQTAQALAASEATPAEIPVMPQPPSPPTSGCPSILGVVAGVGALSAAAALLFSKGFNYQK